MMQLGFTGPATAYGNIVSYHLSDDIASIYYDPLSGHTGASFAKLSWMGEGSEEELKIVKLKEYPELFEQA